MSFGFIWFHLVSFGFIWSVVFHQFLQWSLLVSPYIKLSLYIYKHISQYIVASIKVLLLLHKHVFMCIYIYIHLYLFICWYIISNGFCPGILHHQAGHLQCGLTCKNQGFETVPGELGKQTGNLKRSYDMIWHTWTKLMKYD